MNDTYRDPDADIDTDEDPLQQILSLERRAEAMLREAEADAQEALERATAQTREIAAEAQDEARQKARAREEQTQIEIDARNSAISETTSRDTGLWVQEAKQHLDEALTYVVELVTLRRAR